MLRGLVIAFGVLCVAGGAVAILGSAPGAGWSAVVFGLVLIVGTAYERVRYKPVDTERPGPGWERTGERFVDEESGKTLAVYIHPKTGERKYVED